MNFLNISLSLQSETWPPLGFQVLWSCLLYVIVVLEVGDVTWPCLSRLAVLFSGVWPSFVKPSRRKRRRNTVCTTTASASVIAGTAAPTSMIQKRWPSVPGMDRHSNRMLWPITVDWAVGWLWCLLMWYSPGKQPDNRNVRPRGQLFWLRLRVYPTLLGWQVTYRRTTRQGTERRALSPGWDLSASGSQALQPGRVCFSIARGCHQTIIM